MGHAPRTPRCSRPASARTPIRVGPEDHPLLRVEQGEAVVEQLGALLAPVAAPVAAVGAVAVEAGKDVEGVGSGHDVSPRVRLIGCVDTDWKSRRTSSPSDSWSPAVLGELSTQGEDSAPAGPRTTSGSRPGRSRLVPACRCDPGGDRGGLVVAGGASGSTS